MKEAARRIVDSLVKKDVIWNFFDHTLLRLSRYAEWSRMNSQGLRQWEEFLKESEKKIQELIPDRKVRHGPFKGMIYPEIKAAGSTIFPKLLGSYERELESLVEELCKHNYTEIVNIGCGEGYFAVGFARRIPSARIFAFDIEAEAIRLCRKMAEENQVLDRIVFDNYCDEKTLLSIPITKKTLILCDCDGCEKDIFTEELVNRMKHCDYLIEIHDYLDINISSHIYNLFQHTHDIKIIESIDDIKKAKTYDYEELQGKDLELRKRLLAEYRPAIMEWFFMSPKV